MIHVVGFTQMNMKMLLSLYVVRILTSEFDISTWFLCYLLTASAMMFDLSFCFLFFFCVRNFHLGCFLCFVPHV